MSRYTSKGVKRIIKKGGSLAVTIPSEVAKTLGLSAGEDLAFIRDENGVYIERQQKLVDDYCLLMRQKMEVLDNYNWIIKYIKLLLYSSNI